MILEAVALQVKPGLEDEFEAAFRQASSLIAAIRGYMSHELHRCLEVQGKYLLLVQWETLEAHTIGFRRSPQYQQWKALLHHFYDPFPVVEHFEPMILVKPMILVEGRDRHAPMHPLLEFRDESLLRRALTHCSYINENPGETEDNERLEFLGDALLTFLSAEYLYRCDPTMAEDEMTRRRSALVNEQQLAKFAIAVGLDLRLRLSKGAAQEGGHTNENLLSSAFEAVVGAYYLDQGDIEAVRALVEELFISVSDTLVMSGSIIDAKNRLQEWVHLHVGAITPVYATVKSGGLDHAPEFAAKVHVADRLVGEGWGRSKKEAEKQAAEDALARLKQRGLL